MIRSPRLSMTGLVIVGLMAMGSFHAAAQSSLRRVAIVIGNNFGSPTDAPLHYARKDAEQVAQVLRELGQVKAADMHLLLDATADQALRAIALAESIAVREPTLLFFYYSGHADANSLHLGGSELPWTTVSHHLHQSKAALRIGLIDACQSGMLITPKGFALAGGAGSRDVRGTAIVVSSETLETAQESATLGGSFFTHFLVSGLRGAADSNGDRRVTLTEAQAYTTLRTYEATSNWARASQHPLFEFDITGHRDVVISDLREAAARIRLTSDVSGHVVISEKGSSFVLAEGDKPAGKVMTFALPSGRYLVHVRRKDAINVAEVTLSWGGDRQLSKDDFVARSYQEVAQKGSTLELYRQRLRIGGGVQSALLKGMGAVPSLRVGYGFKVSSVELGVRIAWAEKEFAAMDTQIDALIVGGALSLCYELPLRRIDVRGCTLGEVSLWRQDVVMDRQRRSKVLGGGLELGLRVPIADKWFMESAFGTSLSFPNVEGGRVTRVSVGADLQIGRVF